MKDQDIDKTFRIILRGPIWSLQRKKYFSFIPYHETIFSSPFLWEVREEAKKEIAKLKTLKSI